MDVIPAIDFREGKVVNLRQGKLDQTKIYSEDPLGMADFWVAQGADRLHLVDLDGAFNGIPVNQSIISSIARSHPNLTIQLGGGIRSAEIIESYLLAGVDYLIIGTKAVDEPDFVGEMCKLFPGHIYIGLDGMNGLVATRGWTEVTKISVKSLAQRFEAEGIEAIIYTDIEKDGMMQGVNFEATKELAASVSAPIIASGGVSDIDDIEILLQSESPIAGVIVGRALYEGTLNLQQALAMTRTLQA
mgnify:CR=1 FL=1